MWEGAEWMWEGGWRIITNQAGGGLEVDLHLLQLHADVHKALLYPLVKLVQGGQHHVVQRLGGGRVGVTHGTSWRPYSVQNQVRPEEKSPLKRHSA